MEVAAFVISIISLIFAIVMPIYEQSKNKKVNDINLNSEYLKEIYVTYLTKEIPNAKRYLRYTKEGLLVDVDNLCEVLRKLMKDMYFYHYIDNDFYVDLIAAIQDLEDMLINNEGVFFDQPNQEDFDLEIERKTTVIYSLLNDKYQNG